MRRSPTPSSVSDPEIMSVRMPPLNGLRAFEVAARHLSFIAAAEELNVTPSAVGHQVRALEENLGIQLFTRHKNTLKLTAMGAHFSYGLNEGFNSLARAVKSLRREINDDKVTISAPPALALRWLAKALDRIRGENFGDFLINASSYEVNLYAGEADMEIRYGLNVEKDLHADILLSETVFPVCSPDYAKKLNILNIHDIRKATLLFVDDWGSRGGVWSVWREWFSLAGLNPDHAQGQHRFSEMDMAVKAAAEGKGLAMGGIRHLEKTVSERPLIRIFGEHLELKYSAFLVSLPESAREKSLRRLRTRLLQLAQEEDGSIIHQGAF